MALPTRSRHWLLANKPEALPTISGPGSTFSAVTRPLPTLNDGEVLLKTLYLSNDPAQRLWISPAIHPSRLYVPPVDVGDTMRSYACICQILDSKVEDIAVGAKVISDVGWREYAVVKAEDCTLIKDIPGLEPMHWVSLLGVVGVTAWYGLHDIAHTKASDSIVISGAAGAVGSIAVQIAKHVIGCKRVIGIAGSEAKCRWVKNLGADICLNYKDENFEDQLIAATEGFVEVFYDNVGGRTLDVMLSRLALHGQVVACGAIAEYNSTVDEKSGIKNWYHVIAMRLQLKGMVVLDAIPNGRWGEIVNELLNAYQQGRIKVTDQGLSVVPMRFEDIPKTWLKLFDGSGSGKLLTQLVLALDFVVRDAMGVAVTNDPSLLTPFRLPLLQPLLFLCKPPLASSGTDLICASVGQQPTCLSIPHISWFQDRHRLREGTSHHSISIALNRRSPVRASKWAFQCIPHA